MLLTEHFLSLVYRLKMVKKVIHEKKNGGSDKTTSTKNLTKPKIGKMG